VEQRRSSPFFVVVRLCLAFALGALGVLGLAVTRATSGLSLPFGVLCAGLTLWLLQGAPPEPSRWVKWLAALGGAGLILEFAGLVVRG
jgi:hypothetical protein